MAVNMESEQLKMGDFLKYLPFVREFGIEPVSFEPGRVLVTMPLQSAFPRRPIFFPLQSSVP